MDTSDVKCCLYFNDLQFRDISEPSFPEGYALHTWQEGAEKIWLDIVTKAFEPGFLTDWTSTAFIQKYFIKPQFQKDGFYLVKHGNNFVATAFAWQEEELSSQGKLHWLAVLPEHRKQGIAKALCHCILQYHKDHGKSMVMLRTEVYRDEAIHLYEKIGFTSLAMRRCLFLMLLALLLKESSAAFDQAEENNTLAFLKWYNKQAAIEEYKVNEGSWQYATDLTVENQKQKTKASVAFSVFMQNARKNASKFEVSKLSDDSKRQIKMIIASASPKNKDDLKRLSDLESQMENIYSSSKVLDSDGKKLALDPDLSKILRTSRDYERLKFAWKGWRDATGPKLRPIYKTFVDLSNKGAKENGWKDTGEWWRSWYEADNFEGIVERLYNNLKPLYEELHAYVRYKLSLRYKEVGKQKEPIPAHLFGNMWSQSWMNIYDLVEPYSGEPSLDVTKNMVKQKYTPLRMVKLANEFFTSVGLKELPASFYNKSLIEKPADREVICHASAWDFSINKDVRIKQCTTVTHNYLVTTHHELGHIQYYLQYWDQPYEYRTGANPGFHEAVGDTLSLSVDTPQHLKKVGLLESVGTSNASDINALMKMAMSKIAFLPFGFLIDQWRWNVFKGKISNSDYNRKWWELRTKYQGIKPPVCRSERDFDPGAKYHIPGNTPYIRYFVSYVLQFQFHKAACAAAGVKGPLHQCSIYNSTAAGMKLGEMLAMGKSKPWPDALEKMTGTRKMDVGALKEYFEPLRIWLVDQRNEKNYPIGWDTKGAYQECQVSSSVTFRPAIFIVITSILVTIAYLL